MENTKHISFAQKSIMFHAIEELANYYSNAGCNDLDIPNTPEMEELWKEYNFDNSGAVNENDPDYYPFPNKIDENTGKPNDFVCVHDGFAIFLLKRNLGLLKRPFPNS